MLMTAILETINFTDNALIVLGERYLDEDESPSSRLWDMCLHVASAELPVTLRPDNIDRLRNIYHNGIVALDDMEGKDIATFEINKFRNESYNKFIEYAKMFWEELILPLNFLPNSPTIVNAGKNKGCLSACFVRSPKDTMVDILDCVKEWGLIEKYGGGIGGGFSQIREKGSPILSTHKEALGPVAVMEMLSKVSQKITQGAFREGAHMAQLTIYHPDILEFIHCKDECKSPNDILSNFNISVQVDDIFMSLVSNEKFSEQMFLGSPKDNVMKVMITVGKLWDAICESAWKTGDPGLVFMDRVLETEPNPHLGHIQSSNPCGEQFLEEYGNCNLGSINLGNFIKHKVYNNPQTSIELLNYHSNNKLEIDYPKLESVIRLAVRFLDNVVNINEFPEEVPQLQAINLRTRRIGLGVMGWHDLLTKLGISYDSESAVALGTNLSQWFTEIAWNESEKIAKEKGPFLEWDKSKLKEDGLYKDNIWQSVIPLRNCSVTTVAPTGTISILAGCSSGIEPYFDYVWKRKAIWKDGEPQVELLEAPRFMKESLDQNTLEGTLEDILTAPNKREVLEYFKLNPDLYKPAQEIDPEWHLKHLAAWQSGISNSVSKTINLPNDFEQSQISAIFIDAWKQKCKAITVYRDGSKKQVLDSKERDTCSVRDCEETANSLTGGLGTLCDKHSGIINTNQEYVYNYNDVVNSSFTNLNKKPQSRPKEVPGITHKVKTGHGTLYITVNSINDKPFEVFATQGKAGNCDSAQMESVSRLISLALRSDINVNDIIRQLRGITCCPTWDDGELVKSTSDAIATVLSGYSKKEGELLLPIFHTEDKTSPDQAIREIDILFNPKSGSISRELERRGICPDCQNDLVKQGNCPICTYCGWSKC